MKILQKIFELINELEEFRLEIQTKDKIINDLENKFSESEDYAKKIQSMENQINNYFNNNLILAEELGVKNEEIFRVTKLSQDERNQFEKEIMKLNFDINRLTVYAQSNINETECSLLRQSINELEIRNKKLSEYAEAKEIECRLLQDTYYIKSIYEELLILRK